MPKINFSYCLHFLLLYIYIPFYFHFLYFVLFFFLLRFSVRVAVLFFRHLLFYTLSQMDRNEKYILSLISFLNPIDFTSCSMFRLPPTVHNKIACRVSMALGPNMDAALANCPLLCCSGCSLYTKDVVALLIVCINWNFSDQSCTNVPVYWVQFVSPGMIRWATQPNPAPTSMNQHHSPTPAVARRFVYVRFRLIGNLFDFHVCVLCIPFWLEYLWSGVKLIFIY